MYQWIIMCEVLCWNTITLHLDHVLLQLVGTDIENSLFKYRVNYSEL